MRFIVAVSAAVLLLIPSAARSAPCSAPHVASSHYVSADLSSAKKKMTAKKVAKKKKEKVQYMRANPSK